MGALRQSYNLPRIVGSIERNILLGDAEGRAWGFGEGGSERDGGVAEGHQWSFDQHSAVGLSLIRFRFVEERSAQSRKVVGEDATVLVL